MNELCTKARGDVNALFKGDDVMLAKFASIKPRHTVKPRAKQAVPSTPTVAANEPKTPVK